MGFKMKVQLSKEQFSVIRRAGIEIEKRKAERLLSLEEDLWATSPEDLTLILNMANSTYRAGVPIISDRHYDTLYIRELERQDPNNDFLLSVEPEPSFDSKVVALPEKMLSTDKAYSYGEIDKWVSRLVKSAEEFELPLSDLYIKVTPKLDGYAAYDDGNRLYTRGDGSKGQDVSRAFDRGLKVAQGGDRGQGAGEIVIKKSYFDERLSGFFENARNIQASIIAEKKVDEKVQEAIDNKACVFYPFSILKGWVGHYKDFLESFDHIVKNMWGSVDYEIDGVVAEAVDEKLKKYMGSTRKHHRWQIAYKVNAEMARVTILEVVPQTSRSGRLTPVAVFNPTKLSGAKISRATLHNYGMVRAKGVGKGALVELVRSGLVIPKIENVIESVEPDIPDECPSCNSHAVWDGDNLFCPNTTNCPAQAESTMIHFFKTLRNVDGFGPKIIEKIYKSGVRSIHEIYSLDVEQLVKIGFGEKTSKNLVNQLRASRFIEVEDWRFLAAFGVPRLGEANCEKLLEYHNISDIFKLSIEDMIELDGFAEISASTIFEGLKIIRDDFEKIYQLGFEIKKTRETRKELSLFLNDHVIVFTGTMESDKRSNMELNAKSLGAKVSKSVSGNTTFLVTGNNVGENKIRDAEQKGIKVLMEQEYLEYIALKN
jgi:DNA ligase (NAD+)